MTSEDTAFATARLTLGLSRFSVRSQPPLGHQRWTIHTHDVLDRRKRKRNDQEQNSKNGSMNIRNWLMEDIILTPGSTPLPRPLSVDPPMLAHRYLPISIAGDGAFSRTIFARDTFDPKTPIVAIKAMKPGFEVIGRQVGHFHDDADGRNINCYDGYTICRCRNIHVCLSWLRMLRFLRRRCIISYWKLWNQDNCCCRIVSIHRCVILRLVVPIDRLR